MMSDKEKRKSFSEEIREEIENENIVEIALKPERDPERGQEADDSFNKGVEREDPELGEAARKLRELLTRRIEVVLPLDDIVSVFRDTTHQSLPVFNNLPQTAMVVGCHYDFQYNSILFHLVDESFEIVQAGTIPRRVSSTLIFFKRFFVEPIKEEEEDAGI